MKPGLLIGLIGGGIALLLLVLCGGVGAWFFMQADLGDAVTQSESATESTAGSSDDSAQNESAAEETASEPASVFGNSIPFDEQPTFRRPDANLRYSWEAGKYYGVNFEYQLGENKDVRLQGEVIYTSTNRRPATVVEDIEEESNEATGTGFFVRPDGYLVTCAHVIEGSVQVDVEINGKSHRAKVVAMDVKNDLAILRVRGDDFPYLDLEDSDRVRLAEEVRAFGFPLTDRLGTGIKITRGTVSGINEQESSKVLQLDVTVNPGNSGGPLMNDRGQVVGVVTALMAAEDLAEMSFAVTSNDVRRLLDRHQLRYSQAQSDAPILSGPDLADEVRKSVAFIKVKIGAGGIGIAATRVVEYEANWGVYTKGSTRGQRANESGVILVDSSGEVTYCDGKAAFPTHMGMVALVGIQPLSDDDSKHWSSARVTLVPERRSVQVQTMPAPGLFPPRHGRLSRLYGRTETRVATVKLLPAMQVSTYEVISDSGSKVEVRKTVNLETLHTNDEAPHTTVNGTGMLRFSRDARAPQSLSFTGRIKTVFNDTNVDVPFSLSFQSRDPEKLAAAATQEAEAIAQAEKKIAERKAEQDAIPKVKFLDKLDLSTD